MATPPANTLSFTDVFGPARIWLWLIGSALLACGGSVALLALLMDLGLAPTLAAVNDFLARTHLDSFGAAALFPLLALTYLPSRVEAGTRIVWVFLFAAWYITVIIGQHLLLERFGAASGLAVLRESGWYAAQVLATCCGVACFAVYRVFAAKPGRG